MYDVISSFATVLSMTRGRAASAAPNASPRTRAATQATHWAGEGHRRPAQLGSVGGWVALERSQQNFGWEKYTPLFWKGLEFLGMEAKLRTLAVSIAKSQYAYWKIDGIGWLGQAAQFFHVQSHLLNAFLVKTETSGRGIWGVLKMGNPQNPWDFNGFNPLKHDFDFPCEGGWSSEVTSGKLKKIRNRPSGKLT